eukprot:396424_1
MSTLIRSKDKGLRNATEIGPTARLLVSGKQSHSNLDIHHISFFKGARAPWHVHKYDHEIFYVIDGSFRMQTFEEGKKNVVICNKGDLLHVKPFIPREIKALENGVLLIVNSGCYAEAFGLDVFKSIATNPDKKRKFKGLPCPNDYAVFEEKHGIIMREDLYSKL